MEHLLEKKELNCQITYKKLLDDIDCMFDVLKDSYAMYEYFGENLFQQALSNIKAKLHNDIFSSIKENQPVSVVDPDLNKTVSAMNEALSFIKDGHFSIRKSHSSEEKYDYAVRYYSFCGIPVIDCKKLYYTNDTEKKELEDLKNKAKDYQNKAPLIIDLRDNIGGDTTYMYDFLCELMGCDVGYSLKYIQKNSKLFLAYLKKEGYPYTPESELEITEEVCPKIPNKKPIYVRFNELSASAAEECIAYLRNIERVTLVGDHSAGAGSCGNCISVFLPHSHLEVYFGTGLVLYDGHINIDAEGGFKGDMDEEEFLLFLLAPSHHNFEFQAI